MWPSTLDMTRDECRGVLRRLELETYSSVVSTFRAQGGLNDVKIKILDDLRNVFHISTDRHRAEARRVANDEQLSTIAETVSGPNTMQEWSREGRRSFPMLPRAAPYTALSIVANGVIEAVKNENAKLPYPSETVRAVKSKSPEPLENAKPIVKQDPALLSAEEKRSLKRAHQVPEITSLNTPTNKKRTISGENAQSQTQLHTNTKIQQLYHNHSKTQSRHKKAVPKRNAATPKSKTTILGQTKPLHTPKNSKTADVPVSAAKMSLPIPRNLHTYASVPQQNPQHESIPIADKMTKLIAESPEIASSSSWPQIATSKKDITNNLSKLNMIAGVQVQGASGNMGDANKMDTTLSSHLFIADGRNSVNNLVGSNPHAWTPKSQTTVASGQRTSLKPNFVGNVTKQTGKLLQQSQHLQQPHHLTPQNTITYGSGFINLNQKTLKPESLPLVSERKETDGTTTTKVVTVSSLARMDSTSSNEGNNKSPLIVSGNYDLKTNLENNSPTFISSAGVRKQKIQIHSNQTVNPAFGSLKIPPGVQLKGMTGRKSVQIFSSPGGKVFIQSADNPKTVAQLGSVVSQSNILGGLSTQGNPTTTIVGSVAGGNRYALQKVQIVPSVTTAAKQITMNKSDVIFMPGNVSTASSAGNLVRSVSIPKQGKRVSIQGTNKTIVGEVGGSNLTTKTQNNVIVIGAVSSEKTAKDQDNYKLSGKNITETSMITEDTPVDILTTPLTNLENSMHITQQTKEPQRFDIKSSPITVLQAITTASNDDTNKKFQLHTDALGRLVNHKQQQQQHMQESAQIITGDSIESMDSENNFIISTTDWEVELDQEASKNRNENDMIMREQHIEHETVIVDEDGKEVNASSLNIIDNFHDVIEEDIIDDDGGSIINEDENDVEFEVSYGSIPDDMNDNVAIEYVEETGFSSDVMTEEYGDAIRSDADGSDKEEDSRISRMNFCIDKSLRYSDRNTNGKKSVTSLDSSVLMHEIDENGVNQMRNVTLSEILTASQTPKTADKSINLANVKRISD